MKSYADINRNQVEIMIKLFLYLHLAGLCLLGAGLFLFIGSEDSVNNIMQVSICIGLGLLLISPYPVVKAIDWMKNNS